MNDTTKYFLKNGTTIDKITFYQICKDIQWDIISQKKLSKKFIQRYINFLDSQVYPKYNKLNDDFLIRNCDILDWNTILDTHNISKKVYNSCKSNIFNILTTMNTYIID